MAFAKEKGIHVDRGEWHMKAQVRFNRFTPPWPPRCVRFVEDDAIRIESTICVGALVVDGPWTEKVRKTVSTHYPAQLSC